MIPFKSPGQVVTEGKFSSYMNTEGWEYIARKNDTPVITIVAITPEGKLVLVRQFRKPIDAYALEFPAGLIDAGETPAAAALRELKEETGYTGKVVRVWGPLTKSPGITSELSWLALVRCENREVPQLQDEEDIEVLEVAPQDVENLWAEHSESSIISMGIMLLFSVYQY